MAYEFLRAKEGLVLEGGGALGIGHIGALTRLEELNALGNFKYLAGSSVGSVIVGALACGANLVELKEIMDGMDLTKFKDASRCVLSNIKRLTKTYGWYKGDYMTDWYTNVITILTGNADITLKEIYDKYDKYLIITAYNVDLRETEYYTPATHPDMPLVRAVRRSSGIPVYFQTVKSTPGIDGDPKDSQEALIVDGGWLDNYPMYKLDEYLPVDKVLGLKLYTNVGLHEANTGVKVPNRPANIVDFLLQIVTDARDKGMKIHINPRDWDRSIKINVGTLSSTDFNMSQKNKAFLFINGKDAVDNYINKLVLP